MYILHLTFNLRCDYDPVDTSYNNDYGYEFQICHNKAGEINPVKIKALVEGYVKKFKYHRKRESKVGTSKKS